MVKSFLNIVTLLLVYKTELTVSYSAGAPDFACPTLIPTGHGASTATGSVPYSLSLSSYTYNPGDVIHVTLSGLGGAQFKGYLIVAKLVNGQPTDVIGYFTAVAGSHTTCSQASGNGITHNDSSVKSSVSFAWTSPSTPLGDLVFHYTVVRGGAPNVAKNLTDYFQDLKSGTLKATCVSSFAKNTECGKTRGCFSNCVNNVCDWELSWKNEGAKNNFIIKAAAISDNTYVSLGLSNTSGMSPASVITCAVANGQVTVNASYNSGYTNTILGQPNEGISNVTNSYANWLLECSFSRETISTNPEIFSLSEPWNLITAKGQLKADGTLQYHGPTNRYKTGTKIDFSNAAIDYSFTGTTTTASPSGSSGSTTPLPSASKFPKDTECGKTKGCYSNCKNNICDYLISWEEHASNFKISIISGFPPTGNHYFAFGLNDNNKMNPASVLGCVVYQSSTDLIASFNPDEYNVPLPNPKEGLSNVTSTYVDGILNCTALREIESTNVQIYNLTKPWYLIAARGVAGQGGTLNKHTATGVFVTNDRLNFSDPSVDLSGEEQDITLVKAHGCLMAIAWMFTASLGLSMARFFKKIWPDSKIGGVKIWFAVHRAAMVLTFAIGIAAFVIIFVHVKAYSDITGETYKKAHPILGIIVTGLLFINPFMSLLRCAPDDPKRPIFNWAHWLVGTSAHILGGVTITLGLYLPKANLESDKGLIIMIIYGSWQLVFFLIMSLIDYLSNTKANKSTYDLNDSGSQNGIAQIDQSKYGLLTASNEPKYSGLKKLLMLLHILMLAGLTAVLMYLVIDGDI